MRTCVFLVIPNPINRSSKGGVSPLEKKNNVLKVFNPDFMLKKLNIITPIMFESLGHGKEAYSGGGGGVGKWPKEYFLK